MVALRERTYLGHEVSFVRRRYGNRQTFTWACVKIDGQWVPLGDPWPAVIFPRAERERLIALKLQEVPA